MNSDTYAARLAGFTYLLLLATAVGSMVLFDGLRSPNGISDTLINISGNSLRVQFSVLLMLVSSVTTFVLAVMLFALIRKQDNNLAVLALSCRVGEAVLYAIPVIAVMGLLSLSQGDPITSSNASKFASINVIGEFLLNAKAWGTIVGAMLFSVGSTLYFYLFWKARVIPASLAIFGILASLILVMGIPLQTVNLIRDPVTTYMWIPMFIFEISVGLWLLIKGVEVPKTNEQKGL